ncbi:MAG: hypothetical protein ACLFWB_03725 [Armatimonadota bacterium]
MNSKHDVTRLVATMIGALVGGAFGFWAFLMVYRMYEETIVSSGALILLTVLLFCGGGLVGGGYLLLSLHVWYEKRVRKREDDTPKYGRKKR